MLRRLATVALALALPVTVLPVTRAAASDVPPPLLTVDTLDTDAAQPSTQAVHAPATATVASPESYGGLTLAAPGGTPWLRVSPPLGRRFVAGTTYAVSSHVPTEAAGESVLAPACGDGWYIEGTVTVEEAAYAGDTLTALAFGYDLGCRLDDTLRYAGSGRFNSALPYVLARATVAGPLRAPIGVATPLTVTVENTGTAVTTASAAVLSGAHAADYAVTDDACAGAVLAPGESCAVTLAFTPPVAGERPATVSVPLAGHPRAAGVPAVVRGVGVPAPTAPVALRAWPVEGGTRLAWDGATGEITTYAVHRRAGADGDWTVVASPATAAFTDPALAPGETAQYAVAAAGPGGTSPLSPVTTTTRPLADAAVGTVDALVLDADPGAATGSLVSTAVAPVDAAGATGLAAGGSSATVGLAAPGTYPVGPDGLAVEVTKGALTCVPSSGTVTIAEALFTEAGVARSLAASFEVTCFGATVHGLLRRHSTLPYAAATAAQPAGEWRVPRDASADRTVTVTSHAAPVTFGAATLAGSDRLALVSDGCAGTTLANGQACAIVVRARPGAEPLAATLEVPDTTARGRRTVSLAVTPTTAPSPPAAVAVTWRVGRARLSWEPVTSSGNAPLTAYRVYRHVSGGQPVLVATLPPDARSFTDAVLPGTVVTHGVLGVNEVGPGTVRWTPVEVVPAQEVVFNGTVQDGTDALRAVVPGEPQETLREGGYSLAPAVSPDGTLVAYAHGDATDFDVWVTRADGAGLPRRLVALPSTDEAHPAFSNDGRWIAFTRRTPAGEVSVWVAPVGGGMPVRRATDAEDPAWLADSRSLVVRSGGALWRIAPNGARTRLAGTTLGSEPAVSPDGRLLAFTQYDPTVGRETIAVVPSGGGTPVARLVQPDVHWWGPAWRGDGTRLAASYAAGGAPVRLREVAFTPGALVPTGAAALGTDLVQREASWRSVGLKLTNAPAATRSTATIGFYVGAPYTSATCRLDNAAAVPCAGSFTRTGLSAGTHTLVVTARGGPSGMPERVLAHSWLVDLAAPVLRVHSPLQAYALAPTGTFRFSATDASDVRYDARYRKAPYNGGFGAFASPAGWVNSTATQHTIALAPGWEYCFSARARDAAGNVSAWTPERCVAAPLDDRSLAGSGWTRATAPGYYRGTYTGVGVSGRTLTIPGVRAKRLALVALRCTYCGSVAVYFDGVLVANVNLRAQNQQTYVLPLPAFATVRTGTVTIRTTEGARTVQIDGLGVRRT